MELETLQHYIIFDIDSSSIGTLVFERSIDKKTKHYVYREVFTTRKNIGPSQNTDLKIFFKKTLDIFTELANLAHKYSGNDISEIYINIASPWASSQKRVIHYEKNKDFIFTKELGDTLVKKELELSLLKTHDFKSHGELEIIERKTVDFYINGYPTKHPYGVLAQDVDIHSLISVMSASTKKSFTHVIEKAFHREPQYISNNFMVYQALSYVFPHENNITSLDISGELTEITIIINDHIQKMGTIPVGEYTIIRDLASRLGISFQKAESLISLYQNDNLEESYKKIIETNMKQSFMLWFKGLYSFLDEVSSEFVIPETFSLLAPPTTHMWFSGWILKTEELAEHIHAKKNISILDTNMLFREKKRTEFLSIQDDNLSMCLSFLEKELDKSKGQ